jgi:ferredoxin-NADP reductase
MARRVLHSRVVGALTYPHGIDRYVEIVSPLLLERDVTARITAVRCQTPRSVTITLRPNENWRGIRAGQFVAVGVQVNGVLLTRPYSPAGSERRAASELELTVSTHPDGRLSRHLREHARAGGTVRLSQAQGEFVMPDRRPERVLLISGGSGITPVMAMLRTLCEEGHRGPVGFLNYARSADLALYGPELDRLAQANPALRVRRGYTRGPSALSGRFCREHLDAVCGAGWEGETFVCGPPSLVGAVTAVLAEGCLPPPVVETFTSPPRAPAVDPQGATGKIRFARSDRAAPNSGLVLLEQAEDAGLQPDHGCRMGICNTCSSRKVSGTVRNLLTGECSSSPDQDIRLCVSVPVGDVVLDL